MARPADPPAVACSSPAAATACCAFPAAQSQLDAFPKTLPGLRGSHILDGAGHWVQQERPAEVNKLLIDFLKGL